MTEERAARTLNTVMAVVIGVPVAAFLIWNAASASVAVWRIYQTLAPADHGVVIRWLGSVVLLVAALRGSGAWLRRRFAGPPRAATGG